MKKPVPGLSLWLLPGKPTLVSMIMIAILLVPVWLQAQEEEKKVSLMKDPEKVVENRHILSGLLGYSLLPSEDFKGERTRRLIPSFGLMYGFRFTHWFSMSVNGEVEVDNYILAESSEEFVERDFPFLLTLNAIFEPVRGFGIKFGGGIEIERNEDFYLIQAGVEYIFELPNDWVIGPEVLFITKDGRASGGTFGLAFGKEF